MNKIPHLVFIVPTFNWPLPRTIRARKLISHLCDDYSVTVICFNANLKEVRIDKARRYQIVEIPYSPVSRFVTLRRYSEIEIKGLFLFLVRPVSYFLKRFILFPDAWTFENRKILDVLNKLDVPADIIVASMMPFSVGAIANQYKGSVTGRSKLRVVCDIGDPLSHNVLKSINFNRNRLLRYEKAILEACDHIVVTNIGTLNHYKDVFEIPENKISCIPQGADTVNSSKNFGENVQSEKIDIFYAGTFLEEIRDPSKLFSALKYCSDSVQLKVCGSINRSFKQGNEHIKFIGEVSHSDVYEYYHKCNCLLFFDNSYGLQTSGKIYELLAQRVPILFIYTDIDSSVKVYCEQFGHIIFIENNETILEKSMQNLEKQIAGAVAWLKSDDSKIYNTDEFSWKSRAIEFRKLL